ncbi:MAG: 30S ribosomal protein S4 [Acholeplasmataceae bacterium]|nr:30S ribosomal protein S4 [Acholeplasmataceae bacterium]
MARYTGPSWKISRRLKYSVLENGKELRKRPFAPGQHGQRRGKLSEYGTQLQEKQKVRYIYGMTEKQFQKFFRQAGKLKGKTGENFLILLESRLDNLVYRLGLASTRRQSRQLVTHGHIIVDGRKCDIPSYLVKPGQTIGVKESSRKLAVIQDSLAAMVSRKEYVSFDESKMEGQFVRYPERGEFLPDINETLIVEYYNR